MDWLDYATQVSELEKMARLAPSPAVPPRAPPALLALSQKARCLVCGKRPARACSACGSVSYCCLSHQRVDARWHDPVCGALRDLAEDRRALDREDREATIRELLVLASSRRDVRTLDGWDDYLGSLSPAKRRRFSDLATRPLTLASMLASLEVSFARPGTAVIHVMAAARREADVPIELWAEVARILPQPVRLELVLVGPELPESASRASHPEVALRARRALYDRASWDELGRPDLVIGYDCGLAMYPTWKQTIHGLRGSGVPFVITTLRTWEAPVEARLLSGAKATCLLPASPNPWGSLMGKRSSTIVNDLSFDNHLVSAWR